MTVQLENILHNKYLLWTTTFILSIIYISLGFKYIFNIPLNADDAIICISDLLSYINNESNALEYLLSRKNNNPTLIMRLFTLLDYKLTGQINFKHIIHFSNFGFVVFVIFLTYLYRHNKLALVIPLLLLNPIPNYIYWASASTSYPYTIIILFFILILLNKRHSKYALPLILLLIPVLTFSFSNGFIGVFVTACFAVYLYFLKRLSIVKLSLTIIVSLLCMALFFMGNEESLHTTYDLKFIGFGLAFAGNLGKYLFFDDETMSLLLSIVCIGLLVPIFIKQFKDSEVVLKLTMLAFIIGSGLAAGYVRCVYEMFCTPTAQRYEIFGVFAFVFFCLIISKFNRFYLWIIPVIGLMSCLKIINSSDRFAKEEYNLKFNSYASTLANRHNIRGVREDYVKSSVIAFQEALDLGLMNYSAKLSDLNTKWSEVEDCVFKETFNLKIVNVYANDEVALIVTRIGSNNFDNFYYKHGENCIPIELYRRPSNNRKWQKAYLFLPFDENFIKDEKIEIYAK